jgi:surfactin synthase thioesterase subunit
MLSPWLRRFQQTSDAPTRLVCLPHAGGAASFYFPMAKALAPALDVLVVQYPGRQDRLTEPVPTTIAEFADEVCKALTPLDDRPVALFGHSMGSAIAFELALRLHDQGRPPIHLFASGRRAPTRPRNDNVHKGTDDEIVARLRSMAGTNADLLADPQILAMILPAVRADYRAIETYRALPGTKVDCPVTVLTGDNDPQITVEEAEAWRECVTGPVDIRVYPGGHFFLVDHASAITALIKERLTAA